MANFAVIKSNKVVNIIVADTKEIAEQVTGSECVEYFNNNIAHIGLGYDGSTFEQPVIKTTEE